MPPRAATSLNTSHTSHNAPPHPPFPHHLLEQGRHRLISGSPFLSQQQIRPCGIVVLLGHQGVSSAVQRLRRGGVYLERQGAVIGHLRRIKTNDAERDTGRRSETPTVSPAPYRRHRTSQLRRQYRPAASQHSYHTRGRALIGASTLARAHRSSTRCSTIQVQAIRNGVPDHREPVR